MSIKDMERFCALKQRIEKVPKGEAVLLTGPSIYVEDVNPNEEIAFRGVLGLYRGFGDDMGSIFYDKQKREHTIMGNYLIPDKQVSLGIISVRGIDAPIIRETFGGNIATLTTDTEAYAGPEEITSKLREAGKGLFDLFAIQYLKKHRK